MYAPFSQIKNRLILSSIIVAFVTISQQSNADLWLCIRNYKDANEKISPEQISKKCRLSKSVVSYIIMFLIKLITLLIQQSQVDHDRLQKVWSKTRDD